MYRGLLHPLRLVVCLAIILAAFAGGNRDATTLELPGLNHLFQSCKTGAVSEYGQIEATIAPAALDAIGDWIVERMKPVAGK